MPPRASSNPFFTILKSRSHRFHLPEIVRLFQGVNESRVDLLARALAEYITINLPKAFEKRDGLAHYRTNPYVLMTSASVMDLGDPAAFGAFLFNSKLYMGLETSFGKSIETAFVAQYPLGCDDKWIEAPVVSQFESGGSLQSLARDATLEHGESEATS